MELRGPFSIINATKNNPPSKELSSADEELLEKIKSGEYVNVSLESFFLLAVLFGQVTETELVTFLELGAKLLRNETNYFVNGEREEIVVNSNAEIFIFRTYNQDVFRIAQSGLLQVIEYLLEQRYCNFQRPEELLGVEITIRGNERFFDVEGIAGTGSRTWIGFDLR